jgi:hypothetical protein
VLKLIAERKVRGFVKHKIFQFAATAHGNAVSFFSKRCMSAKEGYIASFVEVPARQMQDRLRCVFLASAEAITVEFEKQDSHHKSHALVAIDKRLVVRAERNAKQDIQCETIWDF